MTTFGAVSSCSERDSVMVSLSTHEPTASKAVGFNYMALKHIRRKSLKDKIEDKEIDEKLDEIITADQVDKAEESKPRVKRKK